jgi:hypothetical protein
MLILIAIWNKMPEARAQCAMFVVVMSMIVHKLPGTSGVSCLKDLDL